MDNYIVSARKYRPSNFHSVVGQKSLTTTLKNAIQSNKLAHAYLFCGPRGVGKTTCARIFAKTINCLSPLPDGEACNECESCKAFNDNRSYNIYELDAASNNSVDDIRSLTDQVRIPPQIGKYKVYIIDEVHMLTTQAFNAFLKTLEEPPHHAVFILATTEKHKIIPTILSRCQTYDFNRISINDIVEYLEYVASSENITVEKEALNTIAQKADGGMRDALSIFDQIVSFSGGNVTYQSVLENLNVLDYEYYFKLTKEMLDGNVSNSLLIFNEILKKGFDGQLVVSGLANFIRDVLICKDAQTIQLFEVGEAVKSKYTELAQICSNEFLYEALKLSNECDLNYRISKNKRLLVEILLIRICQLNHQPLTGDDKKKIEIKPLVAPTNINTEVATATPKETKQATPNTVNIQQPEITKSSALPNKQGVITNNPLRISVKQQKTTKEEEATTKDKAEQVTFANQPFSEEDLIRAWKEYAEIEDNAHFKNTILNSAIKLEEGNNVIVSIYNEGQQEQFEEKNQIIKRFLAEKLNNNQINLITQITENKKEFTPFLSRDKFNYMVDKNPKLQNLVDGFNLRLD